LGETGRRKNNVNRIRRNVGCSLPSSKDRAAVRDAFCSGSHASLNEGDTTFWETRR